MYDLENAIIQNQDAAFYKRLNVPTMLAIYISITLLHVKNCTCNFKETFHAYAINTWSYWLWRAKWPCGIELYLRSRGSCFMPYRKHCLVSLCKTFYPHRSAQLPKQTMKILMIRHTRSRLIWYSSVCKCISEFTWCPKLPSFTLFMCDKMLHFV